MQYASGSSRDHGFGRKLQGPRPGGARRLPLRPHRAHGAPGHPAIARVLPGPGGSAWSISPWARKPPDYSDLLPHMRAFAESAGNTRGNHEHEILGALAPRAGEAVLNKTTMSAFHSSGFERLVRAWGVEQLGFSGRYLDQLLLVLRVPPATRSIAASAACSWRTAAARPASRCTTPPARTSRGCSAAWHRAPRCWRSWTGRADRRTLTGWPGLSLGDAEEEREGSAAPRRDIGSRR